MSTKKNFRQKKFFCHIFKFFSTNLCRQETDKLTVFLQKFKKICDKKGVPKRFFHVDTGCYFWKYFFNPFTIKKMKSFLKKNIFIFDTTGHN